MLLAFSLVVAAVLLARISPSSSRLRESFLAGSIVAVGMVALLAVGAAG
jgi:hypothetical protein